jgi:dienelactone hydrolase
MKRGQELSPLPMGERGLFRSANLRGAGVVFAVTLAIAVVALSRGRLLLSSDGEFSFNRKSIEEFHCSPGGSHLPAVILLHGAGYRGTGTEEFERMCAALAKRGYYAEFIEYFDATENADPTTDPMDNFAAWTGAIHAGVEALGRNLEVDPKRIAVMGFSQGAYLAVGAGAMFPSQVAAVVEYYGGLLPQLRDQANLMPATLIIHGEADSIIPVSEARELDALLSKDGRTHEMHIYPHAGHGFNFQRPSIWYDKSAADDAWKRALDFLDRTLKARSS